MYESEIKRVIWKYRYTMEVNPKRSNLMQNKFTVLYAKYFYQLF